MTVTNDVELVDLSLHDYGNCFNWGNYPLEVYGAYGGLLRNTPVICGGHDQTNNYQDCYSLNQRTSKFLRKMFVSRFGAASIVLNETILWITGGEDGV